MFVGKRSIHRKLLPSVLDRATISPGERWLRTMSNDALTAYVATMTVADVLLKKQIISKRDFFVLEKAMMKKYGFSESSIFRDYRIVFKGMPLRRKE